MHRCNIQYLNGMLFCCGLNSCSLERNTQPLTCIMTPFLSTSVYLCNELVNNLKNPKAKPKTLL